MIFLARGLIGWWRCGQVQGTCEQAIRCWWEDAHPGWMIFTLGNKHFETLDQIIQVGHP